MSLQKSKKPKKNPKVKKDKPPKASSLKLIENLTVELLDEIGFKEKSVKIIMGDEGNIRINVDSPEAGILIGNYGETISSIQLVLSLMLYKKLGEWQKIVLNVGDYLEKREENLKKIALNTAKRVKFSQEEVVLTYLNSAERRIIHLVLADNPDVLTESIGEGRDRRLVIKVKTETKNKES
ncbi:hypothetical protein COT75_04315 [Candidatus Beckwithbacteria bacterium CG10_big_fil_rev_8_21_14_0_10_34_10]|uniref:R3H domain-containing protein n=1 Tax=Candidatus Beckwithbacteria bacterium CG10_big_fil_rev_8_21_14_0_10_34_10 TaxID=1974495 RepID=A0A2H0W893_9BACT|nr:MAG: hypothetical protein COT75_04315 [Candidatus Beckwithbacteria bacterium CG10_big_fil_rev_8_21_14_0_10_34_10]